MRTLSMELELQSDVIQTAKASSLGVHHTLEYIRGSNLLGAAAAKVYDSLGPLAYDAFHSGRVRFLDALLLVDGSPALPIPFGWLYPKGSKYLSDRRLVEEHVYSINHLEIGEAGKLKLQPLKSGFFLFDGRHATASSHYRLKSSIERSLRGRPDQGALFGYESLAAGTRWLARIEIDDGIGSTIDEHLRSAFDDRLIWLGCSRAAEYGRTHVKIVDDLPSLEPPDPTGTATRVAVCLESDTALRDPETGEPTLSARPSHFGLPDSWKLMPFRSMIATREYSPYNGKRRHRDIERLVFCRGSVLTFEGDPSVDLEERRKAICSGVGYDREAGLGRARLNPWYMASKHPSFGTAPEREIVVQKSAAPATPLALWMSTRLSEETNRVAAYRQAEGAARKLISISKALQKDRRQTPTRSQWNRLAAAARRHYNRKDRSVDGFVVAVLGDIFPKPGEAARQTLAGMAGADLPEIESEGGVGANAWLGERSLGDRKHALYEWALLEGLGTEGDADHRLLRMLHAAQLVVRRLSEARRHEQGEES
ncbi:MAG: hypothetical protein GF355_04835 [Candidatus Eisenbacteria bacterium]|nr:hypothetical protein [Candidatus Latescibacterota bacterium]MBD3334819.1 hypothetical protein [Candidatus Eisenbacteria bacterium]